MTVTIALTAAYSATQPRNLSGEQGGQWTSQPPTPAAQAAASDDEEAKQVFAQLLGMSPDEQAKFLQSLPPSMLKRVGVFAYLGTGDPQINGIRKALSGEVTRRGGDPITIGDMPKNKAAGKGKAKVKKGAGGKSKSSPKVSAKKTSAPKPVSEVQQPAKQTKAKPTVTVAKRPAPGPTVDTPTKVSTGPVVTVPTDQQDIATGRPAGPVPVITTARRSR